MSESTVSQEELEADQTGQVDLSVIEPDESVDADEPEAQDDGKDD